MLSHTKKTARLRDRAASAARLIQKEAARIDEEDQFPPRLEELLWEAGFMTLGVPREHGGGGGSTLEAAVVVEELARSSGAAGLAVLLQCLSLAALRKSLSGKAAAERFPAIVHQRQTLAFALSEPESESREGLALTRARALKSEFIISGKKTFVSGAREADLVLVFAVTNPRAGLKRALSAFLVPAGSAGMLPGRDLSRSGLRGVPAVELVFKGCRVKSGARLGRSGDGYAIARAATIACLPLAAALGCGLLGSALETLLEKLKTRDRARPLSEFQPLHMAVAKMAAGLDAARALTWAAARAMDQGRPEAERLARESRWTAAEAAVKGVDAAVRMFGLEASLKGALLERLARDARAAQLLLGPNHLHQIEVARKILSGRE